MVFNLLLSDELFPTEDKIQKKKEKFALLKKIYDICERNGMNDNCFNEA